MMVFLHESNGVALGLRQPLRVQHQLLELPVYPFCVAGQIYHGEYLLFAQQLVCLGNSNGGCHNSFRHRLKRIHGVARVQLVDEDIAVIHQSAILIVGHILGFVDNHPVGVIVLELLQHRPKDVGTFLVVALLLYANEETYGAFGLLNINGCVRHIHG